jgi:hypothetical protein
MAKQDSLVKAEHPHIFQESQEYILQQSPWHIAGTHFMESLKKCHKVFFWKEWQETCGTFLLEEER